jgi:tetratricopeptide (TPR) repeat protein
MIAQASAQGIAMQTVPILTRLGLVLLVSAGFFFPARAQKEGADSRAAEVKNLLLKARAAALQIQDSNEMSNAREYTLLKIGEEFARAGEFESAEETAKYLTGRERAQVFEAIARQKIQTQDISGAEQTSAMNLGSPDNSEQQVNLAQSLCFSGQRDRALEIASRIAPPEDRAEAFARIAECLVFAGKIALAEKTLETALIAAQQVPAGVRKAEALLSIARGFIGTEDKERAQRLLFQAAENLDLEKGEEERSYQQMAERQANIAAAMSKAGNEEAAAQMHRRAREQAAKQSSLFGPEVNIANLARVQADNGNFAEAMETARSAPDADSRIAALVSVGSHYAQKGDIKNAMEILSQIDDPYGRAWMLSEIGQAMMKRGEKEQALELFEKSLSISKGLRGSACRSSALHALAAYRAQSGDLEGAATTAGTIPQVFDRAEAFEFLARLKAARGDTAALLALAEAEKSPNVKASLYLGIAAGMLDAPQHGVDSSSSFFPGSVYHLDASCVGSTRDTP